MQFALYVLLYSDILFSLFHSSFTFFFIYAISNFFSSPTSCYLHFSFFLFLFLSIRSFIYPWSPPIPYLSSIPSSTTSHLHPPILASPPSLPSPFTILAFRFTPVLPHVTHFLPFLPPSSFSLHLSITSATIVYSLHS